MIQFDLRLFFRMDRFNHLPIGPPKPRQEDGEFRNFTSKDGWVDHSSKTLPGNTRSTRRLRTGFVRFRFCFIAVADGSQIIVC